MAPYGTLILLYGDDSRLALVSTPLAWLLRKLYGKLEAAAAILLSMKSNVTALA